MRKILAATAVILAAAAAIAGPAMSAADDIDATVAEVSIDASTRPDAYGLNCIKGLYTGRTGGWAKCWVPNIRIRSIVTCYRSPTLEGYSTFVWGPTVRANGTASSAWCPRIKPYAYAVTYIIVTS